MGCLVKLIKKILIICLIIAFFAFGGWAFLKGKINSYKYPPREVFVEEEKDFGDFSNVSGDYQLIRNFNLFGYRKISAKYLPLNQKITILDLNSQDKLTIDAIETRIPEFFDKFKDGLVTLENIEIIQKGNYTSDSKIIPFIVYSADVKNIPFKKVKGSIAIYDSKNKNEKITTKVIYTMVDNKDYSPEVLSGFINAVKF